MARLFLLAGILAGGIGVMAGAFGAHALEGAVSPERLETFKTGVSYQIYHGLGLLFVGLARMSWSAGALDWAGGLFIAGILLFSGSLYLLVLTNTAWWGAVTPVGGAALILGWITLFWGIYQL
jgi:uncharacterized membrane protein YgdD (TMEM256/DUF423 family)